MGIADKFIRLPCSRNAHTGPIQLLCFGRCSFHTRSCEPMSRFEERNGSAITVRH